MKVVALVILVVGSCTGLGSGPYLPSGWRPEGPAFYLPTEQKTAAVPLKDAPIQETESSGSAFLREYGPPSVQVEESSVQAVDTTTSDILREEVSQDITQQALPELNTEQAFVVIEANLNQNEENAQVVQEAINEQLNSVSEAAIATDTQNTEESSTQTAALVEGKSEVESQTESSLAVELETTEEIAKVTEKITEVSEQIAKVTEDVVNSVNEQLVEVVQEVVAQTESSGSQETENANSNIVSAVEQKTEEVAEVKAVEEGVKNIAEALVNLENEIKAQQVLSKEELSEVKTVSVEGNSVSVPEGFLEYGPPGFTEYGPPKNELKALTETKSLDANNEISETRRRRFSPKFKTPTRKN